MKRILFLLFPLFLGSCAGGPSLSEPSYTEEGISLPSIQPNYLILNEDIDKSLMEYDRKEENLFVVSRGLQGDFFFAYSGLSEYESGFASFHNETYLYNPDLDGEGHNALPGIKNIVVDYLAYEGETLYLDYGWSENYEFQDIPLVSGRSFDFLDQDPPYFRLHSRSFMTVYVHSIELRFTGKPSVRR